MKSFFLGSVGVAIALSATTLAADPASAQFPSAPNNCVYLREITTRQTTIRKVIASNNSNANTDFAVPTGVRFTSYIGRFIPENNAGFTAEVNLKYNDGTSSTVISRSVNARRFYRYDQPFRTPTDIQPFQINVRITGQRNTAYRVAVLACQ